MRGRSILGGAFLGVFLGASVAGAQQPIVPSSYRAIVSRTVLPEPPLPLLGPAGFHFVDPVFGSRMLRITDTLTRPGTPGRSFTTASASHQLAWSATSDRFWIRSVDGTFIPYSFDPNTMTAARILPTGSGDGGLTISSQVEPQFSFLSGNLLFGSRQDPVNDWPIIRQFDFNTLTYTDLLNLGTLTTIEHGTFTGALSSSASSPERLSVIFGGGQQDRHFKVAVFQAGAPGVDAIVLDTLASTITRGGTTSNTPTLGFFLHHAWMDLSGRYVVLYPVSASPAPYLVWDLNTDAITEVTTRADGHDALGFGLQVNQSCCTSSAEDGAQWQLRSLGTPTTTRDLIDPVGSPQETFIADHTSWNNAQADVEVPILSSLYRYFDGTLNMTPRRAWDDEIVAIRTNPSPPGSTVWRFAHHRSDVSSDAGSSAPVYFWYLPRAVISPNGRWAIFTSNWEKTLGSSVGSDIEPGGLHRSDVFLVALAKGGIGVFTDDPLSTRVSFVKAVHITELRARIDALRMRFGLSTFAWTDQDLGAGTIVKSAHLTEMRAALQGAYAASERPPPIFTDSPIVSGSTPIRLVHIQELRDAVIDLETS